MAQNSLLLIASEGKTFFVRNPSSDFHCQFGSVKSSDLKKAKPGSVVKTNKGEELHVIPAGFIDFYRKIKRAPQLIPLKDVGSIITETGINSKSKILDVGTGSGSLALLLANIAKEVITYEIRDDFAKVAKQNFKELDMKNIRLRKKDATKGITEKNIDLVTIDIPEPWRVLAQAVKALKPGGFAVSYSPTIPQVSRFAKAVDKNKSFARLKTIEVSEREWHVEGKKLRPKSRQAIDHSGFLTFVRKIGR